LGISSAATTVDALADDLGVQLAALMAEQTVALMENFWDIYLVELWGLQSDCGMDVDMVAELAESKVASMVLQRDYYMADLKVYEQVNWKAELWVDWMVVMDCYLVVSMATLLVVLSAAGLDDYMVDVKDA